MSRTSARKPFGAKPDSKSSGGKSGGEAASMGLRDQNPTYLKELKRTAMMAGISALVIGIGGTMYLNRSGKQVQSAAQVAAAQAAAVNETADQEYERRRLERTAAAGATWSPAPAAASTVQSSTADAKPPLAVTAEVRQPVAPAPAAPVVQPPSARLPVEIAATATPRGDAPAVIVADVRSPTAQSPKPVVMTVEMPLAAAKPALDPGRDAVAAAPLASVARPVDVMPQAVAGLAVKTPVAVPAPRVETPAQPVAASPVVAAAPIKITVPPATQAKVITVAPAAVAAAPVAATPLPAPRPSRVASAPPASSAVAADTRHATAVATPAASTAPAPPMTADEATAGATPQPQSAWRTLVASISSNLSGLLSPSGDRDALAAGGLRDCPDCPKLVVIPAGYFNAAVDPAAGPDGARKERSISRTRIGRPFAISLTAVTVGSYEKFIATTGHAKPVCGGALGGNPARAVTCVTYADARAYLAWLGGQSGQSYRLPSASEWEYASRRGPADTAATDGATAQEASAAAQPVNFYGLTEMGGGVAEVVADCWVGPGIAAPSDGSAATLDGGCRTRVLMSYAAAEKGHGNTIGMRRAIDPGPGQPHVGFRIARDLSGGASR